MSTLPSINDRDFDLWYKIASNWYAYCTNRGIGGVTQPYLNDTQFSLIKKVASYTASLAP